MMAMSYEYLVGRRYLQARSKRAFVSLITFLSTVGIAMGVMVMIVVIAVMSGAEEELKDRLLGVTAHGVLMRHGGPFLSHDAVMSLLLEDPRIEAATPYVYTQAMIRSASDITGAVLRGIDPGSAHEVILSLGQDTIAKLSPPDNDAAGTIPGILLGGELAKRLAVGTGDLVFLILPRSSGGSSGRAPTIERFRVVGTFATGLYEFDKAMAYISLLKAQSMLKMPDAITGIEVRVKDLYQAREILQNAVTRLGYPFWAQDWMQMNGNLFSALKLQKIVMFVILALIILVAAFNIASALIMLVMEKTRDIAILKTMGATPKSIRNIFVAQGMLIGSIGISLGLALGFVLCFLLKRYKFISLPTDVYFFPFLPVSLEIGDVLAIVAATLLICLLATLYPSAKAARMTPVDALRYG